MACSTDFIEFICDVLAPLGEVRSRKMMGDYVIYACNNIAFIKSYPDKMPPTGLSIRTDASSTQTDMMTE